MTLVPDMSPAIIALNNTGADLGRRMAQFLGGAELHSYCERVSHPDIPFSSGAGAFEGIVWCQSYDYRDYVQRHRYSRIG